MSAGVYMKTRFSHLNLSEVKTLIDEQDSKEPNGEWTIKPNSAVATKQIMTFQILDGTTKQDQVEFTIVISRE
jgi:hypothetical protein